MELINFLFFSFDHHYDIYIITVSKKSGCVNLLTCIVTFGMMILIARLYFYVHLFIENCERPVYVNERKKKNNSFFNINAVSLSKKSIT